MLGAKNSIAHKRPKLGWAHRARLIFKTSKEVIKKLNEHGLGWVVPLFILLLSLAGIFGMLALIPSLAPFVYPLF